MTKKNFAAYIIEWALKLSSRKPGQTYVFPDFQHRIVKSGLGHVSHTIPSTDEVDEMIDVFEGGKVFSARRGEGTDWKIVTFKRGEWEKGLLFAAAAYSM